MGVRQGCPLTPHLFLEVMNAMLKKEAAAGNVKGVKLPIGNRQQVVTQYADDTSLTLLGKEGSVQGTIHTLETFCAGFGLVLNCLKSCGYWRAADGSPRPAWSDTLNISWAGDADVNKLLGTVFGLSLTSGDVDTFFLDRINKSLSYWSTTKVNATRRGMVVNGKLLSSTYFFTSLWGASLKGVKKVCGVVANYFWSYTMNRSRNKVSWLQCCQTQSNGGVNLVNPTDAMTSFMNKWILKAVELGTSNLHLMLRFRLEHFQPYSGDNCAPSLELFTLPKFQAKQGSCA
jgi:hypothetical protein